MWYIENNSQIIKNFCIDKEGRMMHNEIRAFECCICGKKFFSYLDAYRCERVHIILHRKALVGKMTYDPELDKKVSDCRHAC